MVAAHPNDLKAWHACGLRTAFVSCLRGDGPGKEAASAIGGPFDVTVRVCLEPAGCNTECLVGHYNPFPYQKVLRRPLLPDETAPRPVRLGK
jgi:hypothetical protein